MDHRGDAYFSLLAAGRGAESHDGAAQDYGLKFQQQTNKRFIIFFFFYPSGTAP